MSLDKVIELGMRHGRRTVGECIDDVKMHPLCVFEVDKIEEGLSATCSEAERLGLTSSTYISDALSIMGKNK